MSNLNWQQHDKDISTFVRNISNFYLRTEASTGELLPPDKGILLRNNYATPNNIRILLNYLGNVTDKQINPKVSAARSACLAANIDWETCKIGSTTFFQIYTDYEKWIERYQEYVTQTAEAQKRNPDASGDEDPEFWTYVTKPLLLGIFPGADQQTRLDAVTPLIIAWQIEVAEDAYREARKKFWVDLKAQAKQVLDTATGFGLSAVLIGIGAVAFGYGYTKGR